MRKKPASAAFKGTQLRRWLPGTGSNRRPRGLLKNPPDLRDTIVTRSHKEAA